MDDPIYTEADAAAIDECDRHPLKMVRFVPAADDDTDW